MRLGDGVGRRSHVRGADWCSWLRVFDPPGSGRADWPAAADSNFGAGPAQEQERAKQTSGQLKLGCAFPTAHAVAARPGTGCPFHPACDAPSSCHAPSRLHAASRSAPARPPTPKPLFPPTALPLLASLCPSQPLVPAPSPGQPPSSSPPDSPSPALFLDFCWSVLLLLSLSSSSLPTRESLCSLPRSLRNPFRSLKSRFLSLPIVSQFPNPLQVGLTPDCAIATIPFSFVYSFLLSSVRRPCP